MKRTPSKYPIVNGVMTYPDGRERCLMGTVSGAKEYERRRLAMERRQGYVDPISLEWLVNPTFDHQDGRGAGGSRRDDRIEIDGKWHNAALNANTNGRKGSKRYEWRDGLYVPSKAGEQPEGGK